MSGGWTVEVEVEVEVVVVVCVEVEGAVCVVEGAMGGGGRRGGWAGQAGQVQERGGAVQYIASGGSI